MAATFLTDIAGVAITGVSILPQTIASATTVSGSAVDLQQGEDTVFGELLTGNCGDSTLTLTAKLQEAIEDTASPGNPLSSDWSDFSPAAAFTGGAGATTLDNAAQMLTGRRSKRFVRVAVTTTGGGTLSAPVAASVLCRKKISGTGNGAITDH